MEYIDPVPKEPASERSGRARPSPHVHTPDAHLPGVQAACLGSPRHACTPAAARGSRASPPIGIGSGEMLVFIWNRRC